MDATGRGRHVGITGPYGVPNLSDEAILEASMLPPSADLHAAVIGSSGNVQPPAARHGVDAVPVRTMTKNETRELVRTLDLMIFGGGGILYDEEAQLYLREANLAHEVGVPVMVYGLSAGPLSKPHNRDAVRESLNRCK